MKIKFNVKVKNLAESGKYFEIGETYEIEDKGRCGLIIGMGWGEKVNTKEKVDEAKFDELTEGVEEKPSTPKGRKPKE